MPSSPFTMLQRLHVLVDSRICVQHLQENLQELKIKMDSFDPVTNNEWRAIGECFKLGTIDPYILDARLQAVSISTPRIIRLWANIVATAALHADWPFDTRNDPHRQILASRWVDRLIEHFGEPKHWKTIVGWCRQDPWLHDCLMKDAVQYNDAYRVHQLKSCQPHLGHQSLLQTLNVDRTGEAYLALVDGYPYDIERLNHHKNLVETLYPNFGLDEKKLVAETVVNERKTSMVSFDIPDYSVVP